MAAALRARRPFRVAMQCSGRLRTLSGGGGGGGGDGGGAGLATLAEQLELKVPHGPGRAGSSDSGPAMFSSDCKRGGLQPDRRPSARARARAHGACARAGQGRVVEGGRKTD